MPQALPFQTAKQLAAAIRKKKIGCLELLDLYLERVKAYNPELNAIIAMDVEGARKRARAADKAVKAGRKLGPLHGVPMTIKESFDVAGYPTTWGDPAFKDTVIAKNSLVAQRMIDAGVTLFGKTNVPLNLADWQSYNEVYGSTNNPWDLGRTPGGSSGGSGAALAAGLTGIEAGSDIGASIRNPAHYCGVWGHKPSWGVVSPKGHALAGAVAYGDIGVVGPLARGAEDLEIALTAMAGPDSIDGRGWTLSLPRSKKTKLRDFKVAVLLTDPNAEVDDSVQLRIIHRGVGAITKSDVTLASASDAVVVGFNVRPEGKVAEFAAQEGVDVRFYSVIYQAIDEIESALRGMLKPEFEEVQLGTAEVREVFKSSKFGTIAGCLVRSGEIRRNTKARLVRDGAVVANDLSIATLRRFKDDVTEVREGFECGINLGSYGDVKVDDVIETYEMREKARA